MDRWVPVEGTVQVGDRLRTRFMADQIKAAPRPTVRAGRIEPATKGPCGFTTA